MQKQLPIADPISVKPGSYTAKTARSQFFESADQAPDLRRFPTRFAPFKCDKETGHPFSCQ